MLHQDSTQLLVLYPTCVLLSPQSVFLLQFSWLCVILAHRPWNRPELQSGSGPSTLRHCQPTAEVCAVVTAHCLVKMNLGGLMEGTVVPISCLFTISFCCHHLYNKNWNFSSDHLRLALKHWVSGHGYLITVLTLLLLIQNSDLWIKLHMLDTSVLFVVVKHKCHSNRKPKRLQSLNTTCSRVARMGWSAHNFSLCSHSCYISVRRVWGVPVLPCFLKVRLCVCQ